MIQPIVVVLSPLVGYSMPCRPIRCVQVVVLYLVPVRVDRHRDVGTSRLDLLWSEKILLENKTFRKALYVGFLFEQR